MATKSTDSDHQKWKKTCSELQKQISPDAYQRWFHTIRFISFDSGVVVLGIENSIYQFWIEENYLHTLKDCIALHWGRDAEIQFEVMEPGENGNTPPAYAVVDSPPVPVSKSTGGGLQHTGLTPRYTFETFVVGTNNEFAHAACQAVAHKPSKIYNPLFIHGATGLGKTHLMHAVGHEVFKSKARARIVYVTSEQFTNEFVSAIQHGELVQFRKRFRQADALLIDDIQFFAGKDRSQEEFFHTFNALFDGNKQIVLTSDSPPTNIQNLEQRLVSRFEWGLAAELQPPDIETRLAILRAKAASLEIRLGDSVLMFIAERVKANIRRLEGALNRVAASAALNDRKITQEQVEMLLKDFIQEEARHVITIEMIQKRVTDNFDLRLSDMTSKRRPNHIAIPRMVAMYLSRKMTSKSLQEIGEAFGGRDHGTVLHACRSIEDRMSNDASLRQQVHMITQKLEVQS